MSGEFGADQDLKHHRVAYQNGAVQVLAWKGGWECTVTGKTFIWCQGIGKESNEEIWDGANRVFVIHIFQSLIYDLLIERPNSPLRKMK